MARIRIDDLPVLEELSEKQAKGIFGGGFTLIGNYSLTDITTDTTLAREGLRLEGRLEGYEGWPCKW